MEYKPRFSLIICCKDHGQKLKRCLEAISQDEMLGVHGELVLVNNNSNDDTKRIMLDFKKEKPFPVEVIDEPLDGVSRARNAGISRAKGEVVAFVDADCYFKKGYITKAASVLDSVSVDYCSGQVWRHSKDNPEISLMYFERRIFVEPYSFIGVGDFLTGNIVFSRLLIKKVGLFDVMLGRGTFFPCEDSDYAARASWSGFRGCRDPELVVIHDHGRGAAGEEGTIIKAYDYGRGAYYTKFILAGKFTYLLNWLRLLNSKAALKRFPRELFGGLRYILARTWMSIRTGMLTGSR